MGFSALGFYVFRALEFSGFRDLKVLWVLCIVGLLGFRVVKIKSFRASGF